MLNWVPDVIIPKLDQSILAGVGLSGSHSRGHALPYSDIDILCLVRDGINKPQNKLSVIDGKYTVFSYVTSEEMENTFKDPVLAVQNICGLRNLKPLWDPEDRLNSFKTRACQFKWTEELQKKANDYASTQLAGWVEEVNKALNGLRVNDIGRMLNGLFGLSHGLLNVLLIQKGLLLNSENEFFQKVIDHYGPESEITRLGIAVFGAKGNPSLQQRVSAGLEFFMAVTNELESVISPQHSTAIDLARTAILQVLPYISHSK